MKKERKDSTRNHIKAMLALFCVMFIVLSVYLGYIVNVYGNRWFASPYNTRVANRKGTIAAGMLLELKAMGVDKAVLVSAREFGGSDTFATSQILAAAIKNLGVDKDDIIFCGRQAIDGDTAQVGPQIAEKLEIPQVSYVADIQKDGDTLTVRRMLEDGYMTVQVQTPCLLTCIKELNTPRYMTIRGILDCDAEPVTVLDYNALKDDPLIEVDTIGLKGSPTNIYKSFTPPRKGSGMMLEGSGRETVERLFGILSAKHII